MSTDLETLIAVQAKLADAQWLIATQIGATPPGPTPINYAQCAGITIDACRATKFGGVLPSGWSDQAAFAAGVLPNVNTPPPAGVQLLDPFNWPQVGEHPIGEFQDGVIYAKPTTVPAGYTGKLQFFVVGVPEMPSSVSIKVWASLTLGGPDLGNTMRSATGPGPGNFWNGATNFATSNFRTPTGIIYFCFQITREDGQPPPSRFALQENHQ